MSLNFDLIVNSFPLLLMGALVVAIGTALAARSMFAGTPTPQVEAAQQVASGPKVLVAQVVSGLLSDDEISFSGPLVRFVSGEWVGLATWFHSDLGQYLLIGLVALHLLAIGYYVLVRRRTLVRPMLHGDKLLTRQAPASRDDVAARTGAAVVAVLSAALAWWISGLGAG